ncbi:MAG TPA: LamG-like jellyroll fold domain-containing protein, partial [Verrucomicrobiae bacterium]|nr:LamG-like jellyroll fold domain-containing protein [Verrucomicrobiae bacterium]
DGTTQSQICINNGQQVLDVSVGVRINDPNLDDLVLHLTSPQGTSVLLFEDRGGLAATSLGLGDTLTNTIYTVFTDDTNQTTTPIKFANEFATSNGVQTDTVITGDGFENMAAGTYTNGQRVGNWTVATNQVGVITEPSIAHTGSNYLALTSGRITNTFMTVPGAAYELQFWARGSGITNWWPGDDNTDDIINTNNGTPVNMAYDVGEVARAFTFNGTTSGITFGPNVGNFGTNDFTIDFWLKTSSQAGLQALIEKRQECDDNLSFWGLRINTVGATPGHLVTVLSGNNAANYVHMESNAILNNGNYHHIALTRNGIGPNQTLNVYVDGVLDDTTTMNGITDTANADNVLVGTSVCEGSDGTVAYTGDLDELDFWSRALSGAEVHAIYAAGSAGKYSSNSLFPNFELAIDGYSTNTIILTNFDGPWRIFTNSFIATNTETTIELAGNTLSTLFDDIQLIKLPSTNYDNYFLPEEPLAPFIGENPEGCWTLDIWDTRTDSLLTNNGTLLSWDLQMTSSSTNVNLTVLTNREADTNGALAAGSIAYFAVDVPTTANFATNILSNVLSASGLNLFFNQTALPTGSSPGDVELLGNVGLVGSKTLSTLGAPPPLVPGSRYYLEVENPGSTPAKFTLEVDFDVGNKYTNIYALTNEVSVATNISTNGPSFYSFTVPANATMVTFQILNPTNAEVDLYAREGLPVPGPFNFDYDSRNLGANDQFIVVTTNSEPVSLPAAVLSLPPTTWYLSVYNPSGVTNAGYTLVATYATNSVPATVPLATTVVNLIALTNGISYTNTAVSGFPTNFLYSFSVPGNPAGLQFAVTNLSRFGNVQLLAQNGTFPTPSQSYSGSFNSGTGPQMIAFGTNVNLPALTNTTWYLAVPNTSTNNSVNYTITVATLATAPVTTLPLFIGASISTAANQFTLTWNATPGQNYLVQVSANLITWNTVANIVAQSSTITYTDSVPVNTQRSRFFRISTP